RRRHTRSKRDWSSDVWSAAKGTERIGSFDIDKRNSVIISFVGINQRDACWPFQFSVGVHFIVGKNNRGVLRASLIAHAAVVVRGSNLGELSILVNDHA